MSKQNPITTEEEIELKQTVCKGCHRRDGDYCKKHRVTLLHIENSGCIIEYVNGKEI